MPSGTLTLYQIIGYVYKISHKTNINLKFYIGSTEDMPKREGDHKTACNNPNDKNYNIPVYKYIRENGGWNAWTILPILRSGKYQEIEALFIRRTWSKNVNIVIPGRTYKEWYQDNREALAAKQQEYSKEYYKNNKVAILARHKKVCICEYCGKNYIHYKKARQQRSIKCRQFQQ